MLYLLRETIKIKKNLSPATAGVARLAGALSWKLQGPRFQCWSGHGLHYPVSLFPPRPSSLSKIVQCILRRGLKKKRVSLYNEST